MRGVRVRPVVGRRGRAARGDARHFLRRYRVPLTRGLKGEDLDALVRAHPLEGVWSALSYACHTRDVLRVFRERTQRMLAEDDPDLGWWDHDASVLEDRYDEDDPIEVADAIDANAAAYADVLAEVAGDSWARTGVPPQRRAVHGADQGAIRAPRGEPPRPRHRPRPARREGTLMSGLDVSRLTAADCVAALRFLPRLLLACRDRYHLQRRRTRRHHRGRGDRGPDRARSSRPRPTRCAGS